MSHQDSAVVYTHQQTSDGGQQRLRGNLGVKDLIFTVLAFNAPLGTTIGFIPVVIGFGNGLGAPVIYLAAGALLIFFAAGFCAMGRRLPNPGAFYAYITAGLGKPVGLGSSFIAVFAYLFILLGSYCFGGIALQSLVRDTFGGPDIAWWLWALLLQAAAGTLGYFRVELSAKVLGILLLLEIVVVVVLDAVVIFSSSTPEGFSAVSFTPEAVFSGSVGLALLFGITGFSGFEATAIFREEVRDPDRTIPRATYGAIVLMGTMYALGAWILIQAVGPSSVVDAAATDPTGTSLGVIGTYLGKVAVDIVTVLLCTSIFAANLATHNVTTRYLYNLGVDRIFPHMLAGIHARHGSPYKASVATSIIVLLGLVAFVIGGADPTGLYATLIGIGGYAYILLLLLTSLAVLGFFSRTKDRGTSVWNRTIAPALALVGFIVSMYLATVNIDLLLGGSPELSAWMLTATYGIGLVGILLALLYRRHRPETYARIGRQEI